MVTLAFETCVLPLFGKFLSSQVQTLHEVLLTLIPCHGYAGTGKFKLCENWNWKVWSWLDKNLEDKGKPSFGKFLSSQVQTLHDCYVPLTRSCTFVCVCVCVCVVCVCVCVWFSILYFWDYRTILSPLKFDPLCFIAHHDFLNHQPSSTSRERLKYMMKVTPSPFRCEFTECFPLLIQDLNI